MCPIFPPVSTDCNRCRWRQATFKADSLTAGGTVIKLHRSATREGDASPPNAAVLIPVVGPFTVFKHGKDADIKPGTPFTALVSADTPIAPPHER
jgi:hypothetical protein